jgi:protease PrsW
MIRAEFAYALIAGILPPLVWLFFWLREDRSNPEPKGLLTGTFFAGMLAVVLAIPIEQYISTLGLDQSSQYIAWAAVEEFLKFIAVAVVALRSRAYDEPIDAMIYSMTVALGFAALENTLFVMGPFSHGSLAQGIVFGNMRFIGATLVHLVSSTLIGFSLGLMFYRSKASKILCWVGGVGGAIAIHAGFNLMIIHAGSLDTLKTFALVWAAVVIMIILFEEIKAVRPHFT